MPRAVDRGLELASQLTRKDGDEHFYPFLLDIVVTLLRDRMQRGAAGQNLEANFAFNNIPVNSILSAENENDWIIYRICAREFQKYPHGLDPDSQVACMLSLAVNHRGLVPTSDLPQLVEQAISSGVVPGQAETLLAHPLLRADERALGFQYDVIREHYRSVYVSYLFRSDCDVTVQGISLLGERNKFAPDQLRQSAERIRLSPDEILLRAVEILAEISRRAELSETERSRAKTTLLLIVLQSHGFVGNVDRTDATGVLRELFGCGEGKSDGVSGVALIDVRERLAFNFCDVRIIDSNFSNYDHFWDCEFGSTTMFEGCNLSMLRKGERQNTALRRGNFDRNCVIDQTVVDAIETQAAKALSTRQQREQDVVSILRVFLQSGYLMPQKEAVVRARYRGQWPIQDALKVLLEHKILLPYSSRKSAKIGPELQVAARFHADVRKLVQEAHATEQLRSLMTEVTS